MNSLRPSGPRLGKMLWGGLALWMFWSFPAWPQARPVDEVKALVQRGLFKEAYERGRRYPDQLGEPTFDYFYGLAAIDSGHAGEGTLALERYVITYPNDQAARLELARGYFLMQEDQRAREEFDRVLAANPPEGVRANIRKYLDAMRARESRYRTTFRFFAEAGAGYDSNVNGGVSNGNITLPFGQVIVQDSGVKADNGFLTAAAGAQWSVPVAPGWSVFFGGSADTKNHLTQDTFDLRSLTASGGVSRLGEKDLLRLTAAFGSLTLDNTRYRDVGSLSGEWHRQTSSNRTWSALVQWAQLGYTGNNEARDADIFTVGAGVRQALGGAWNVAAQGGLTFGLEANRRNRDDLGRTLSGARLGLTASPQDRITFFATASLQNSEYLEADAFLARRRSDWYYALDAGSSYALDKQWSVRLELTAARNRSNIELYDFNRNVAAVKVRYETP